MDFSTQVFSILSCLPEFAQNSHPLSQWYHPTISSSVVLFSSCPQSFLASESLLMSWLFLSGGQSIGASASASVLPMNIQDWFPLGLTSLISLQSKGLSRVFSNTIVWKHQFFTAQLSLWFNSHICPWLLEKPLLWLYRPLSAKWRSLLFNTLSGYVIIAFLPRSKSLLWLASFTQPTLLKDHPGCDLCQHFVFLYGQNIFYYIQSFSFLLAAICETSGLWSSLIASLMPREGWLVMLFSWTSLGGRGRHKASWVGGAPACARWSVTGLCSGLLCPSPTVAVLAVGHPRNSWVFLVGERGGGQGSPSLFELEHTQ